MPATRVLSSGRTASALGRCLGPLREWSDFLADCRRGRTNFYGLVLLPCCEVVIGRKHAPHYDPLAVARFILAVQRLPASKRTPMVPDVVKVNLDPADLRPWPVKRLSPLARARHARAHAQLQ